MIDSAEIYRALKESIQTTFPNISILTKYIKTPTPPCFYISSVADNSLKTATDFFTSKHIFSVIYYAEEVEHEELLVIKDELKRVFLSPIKIVSLEDESDIGFVDIKYSHIRFDRENNCFNAIIRLEVTQRLSDLESENSSENDALIEDMVYKLTKGG